MKHKAKSANCCWRRSWIHISDCASISHMRFEKEVWLAISNASIYTFWIISEIHRPVFYSFEKWSTMMLVIEHSVFPLNSWRYVSLGNLEAVSIMSIVGKVLEISDPHMNDDRGIVHDIMMQVLKVILTVTKLFDSVNQQIFVFLV